MTSKVTLYGSCSRFIFYVAISTSVVTVLSVLLIVVTKHFQKVGHNSLAEAAIKGGYNCVRQQRFVSVSQAAIRASLCLIWRMLVLFVWLHFILQDFCDGSLALGSVAVLELGKRCCSILSFLCCCCCCFSHRLVR